MVYLFILILIFFFFFFFFSFLIYFNLFLLLLHLYTPTPPDTINLISLFFLFIFFFFYNSFVLSSKSSLVAYSIICSMSKLFNFSHNLIFLLWGIFSMPLHFLILVFFFFFLLVGFVRKRAEFWKWSIFFRISIDVCMAHFSYISLQFPSGAVHYSYSNLHKTIYTWHNTHKQTHRHDNTTGKGGVTDCTHQPNIYFKSPYNMRVI